MGQRGVAIVLAIKGPSSSFLFLTSDVNTTGLNKQSKREHLKSTSFPTSLI
jgi:hypothetical protein